MAMSADELRRLLAEFITQQRRLERIAAWGEPTPARLADATRLLESARFLLTRAENVIREGPERDGGIDAEDACTCLAILVPSLLASVGYEDPPPPTFTGILADLAEARDTLRNPRTEQDRAEALGCLDDIIDLVGQEADKARAGKAPGYWRLRLKGAVRVSRALVPHVATTTAVALVSSGSGGAFTAALSTAGTSIAAILLPSAKDLRDLFHPPELRPSVIALHRTAAEKALREGRRLLAILENPDGEAGDWLWADQAHAAAELHLRVLSDVPEAGIAHLERDADDLLRSLERLEEVADGPGEDTPDIEPHAVSLQQVFEGMGEDAGEHAIPGRVRRGRRTITRAGQPLGRNGRFEESTIDANVPETPPPGTPDASPPRTPRLPPPGGNGIGSL
ncbi:hypothetical protein [Streptomyces sp. NPDC058145]|uniref:hypothetical protein n=1 Tax=Streptomyces sp. NPDC058145 TaxID=3346356 RepID=UPI0036E6CDC7